MFLLNRKTFKALFPVLEFTSHYVPIKSEESAKKSESWAVFTSHYVPIKS